MEYDTREATTEAWQQVLEGEDVEAFERLAKPCMDTLLGAAQHDLAYYVAQGYIHQDDLTPEEVTGETLIYAWEHRRQRPKRMSLRGWLLGTQHRVLGGLVAQQKNYRENKAISLDEPLPPDPSGYDIQEWFWDWYQPENQITWEDIIPGAEPVDIELDLEDVDQASLFGEDETARHVLLLHDHFAMPLPEVAFTMNRAVNDVAGILQEARASLHKRMVEEPVREEPAPPAPPQGADQ